MKSRQEAKKAYVSYVLCPKQCEFIIDELYDGFMKELQKIDDINGTCNECKHLFNRPKSDCIPYCEKINKHPKLDWFCADFERKQDEEKM